MAGNESALGIGRIVRALAGNSSLGGEVYEVRTGQEALDGLAKNQPFPKSFGKSPLSSSDVGLLDNAVFAAASNKDAEGKRAILEALRGEPAAADVLKLVDKRRTTTDQSLSKAAQSLARTIGKIEADIARLEREANDSFTSSLEQCLIEQVVGCELGPGGFDPRVVLDPAARR